MTEIFRGGVRLAYRYRRPLIFLIYASLATAAYTASYLLRFEFLIPRSYARVLLFTLGPVVAVRLLALWLFRLVRGRWRFVSTPDVARLVVATSLGSLVLLAGSLALPAGLKIPRSVILIEWVLHTYLVAGVWLAYRLGFERLRRYSRAGEQGPRRAILVGAGEAGNLLAREMLRFPAGYRPVAFVDDEPMQKGSRVQGVEVLGTTEDLPYIARLCRAEEIIIAIPSASPAAMRRVVERCKATRLRFKILPGIAQVLNGDVRVSQLREVRIEDLLGRDPIELELPELSQDLAGRCVLITGAAGSIGSELARQVALHRPARLVLVDQAESELYMLLRDLREAHPDLPIVPMVADVVDAQAVERAFATYPPERVFHAAAYKHVPLMEANPREAIRNNLIGTARVAEAAGRSGAGKFVLVSTDKAVRPASVMGATKRLAELAVIELQESYPRTSYCAVRFGNVLGSNGSVLPIFRRQLSLRRPLTVTHPQVTRYFMTIAESVQLILQASLLPEIRGRIAMLDMGEPVRILDLAENLRRLSGDGWSSEVVFTGLRPGEKLHEELVAPDEESMPTSIGKVRLIRSNWTGVSHVAELAALWDEALAGGRDEDVLSAFGALFPSIGRQGIGEEAAPVAPARGPLAPRMGTDA